MEGMYGIMNILGPVALLLVLVFFTVRQWKRRPREEQRADEGAKRLREELNRERNG